MRALTRSTGAIKRTTLLLCAAVVILFLSISRAGAANPPLLTATPEVGVPGQGVGQLQRPNGIAQNPINGDIYVSDAGRNETHTGNNRVSEFSPWGVFLRSFGWGVANGDAEPQACTVTCRAGIPGAGAGQLDEPGGIVSDASGDLYVVDTRNLRVEKFSPTGAFLLVFGYGVNKSTGADVCTAADVAGGDECGPGREGTEVTEFSKWSNYSNGSGIAISPTGDIYVGDAGRIQVFGPDGRFVEAINFSEVPGLPDGNSGDPVLPLNITQSIAFAPDGNLYLAFHAYPGLEDPHVYEVDPTTRVLVQRFQIAPSKVISGEQIEAYPRLLSTDAEGNLYVASYARRTENGLLPEEILIFDSSGKCSSACPEAGFAAAEPFFVKQTSSIATGDACGPTDIYAGYEGPVFPGSTEDVQIRIYGPPPDPSICPPPVVAPTIKDQFASSVGSETATVKASINPHFWPDTSYYVEYGTEDCATGSCVSQSQASLGGQVVDNAVRTAGVFLHGLRPGITYHYRFVSQSSGGGPVFGPDRTFTTYPITTGSADSCPNAVFRTGFAAALPDCRAFEMVSPLDKEGGDIVALKNVFGYPATMNQSDVAGQRMTYSAARNFGDAQSGAYTAQYMATRTTTGWSTEAITPPRTSPIYERGQTTDTEYKAFSPDLCAAWLRHDSDPPLADGAPAGFANLYRRDSCPETRYDALRTPPPVSKPGDEYEAELQGVSAGQGAAIFAANESLTADAPLIKPGQFELYESRPGQEPRYVCVLPNERPDTGGCTAGSYGVAGGGFGRTANVQGAISEDGSRIFWSNSPRGDGKLYLRVGGIETWALSAFAESKSRTNGSYFWAAAADGSRAIFTTGENLWQYNVETGVSTKIAGEVSGVLGVSKDAGHVYFVSEEALGGAALAGRHNLYLSVVAGEEHKVTFVAELSAADAEATTQQQIPSAANAEPIKHVAHVTPDGDVLAFMSTGNPTGFDNADADTGKPDAEVYIYDARSGELHCVSCNRTGARPRGKELEVGGFTTGLFAAAELPTWENELYDPRVLSSDGHRLFFESYEPLVPSDSNDQLDLYEWEAPGTGSCHAGEVRWTAAAGGCIDMISSGQSPYPSEFVDATPDGSNVYFSTLSSLVLQDYGLVDIYDARVEGGFPPPPPASRGCEGSSCQNPPPAPAPSSPSSQNFHGPGTPAAPKRKHCPKGKRPVRKGGKQRCVAKKKKHHKAARKRHHQAKRTGKTRRAGR